MIELRLDIGLDSMADEQLGDLPQTILLKAALELYRLEKLTSEQAAKLAGVSYEQFLQELGELMPMLPETPLTASDSLQGSKYLARVLWALREGRRRSLPAMTAAEIAKFVCSNSEVSIETTNTARFFRECRESGRFECHWLTCDKGPRRRYELSLEGRKLLRDGNREE